MAEPLRREEDFRLDELPDTPSVNAVPPRGPRVPAGDENRGDILLGGDEVDLTNRPDHLLDAHDDEKERRWPLGRIPGRAMEGFRDGSWRRMVSDHAEEWKDRIADVADDVHDTTLQYARRFEANWNEWRERSAEFSRTSVERANERAVELRDRAQRWIDEEPAQAIAVAAGIGFLLGVALRLGRKRREY